MNCAKNDLIDDSSLMNTYARYPVLFERGEGVWLWDSQGEKYLDFGAGIAVCSLGHSSPIVRQAAEDQLKKLQHVSNLYYTRPQVDLANWLVKNSFADKVFLCNSGAEANEGAIKLIRKYARAKLKSEHSVIFTAQHSFHGRTLGALTATAQPKYQESFGPLVPGFHYTPYNNLSALSDAIEFVIKKNSGEVPAAVLIEPLQGEGGVTPGTSEYLKGVRALCDRHQMLLAFDEVQTGNGRTGTVWCYEQYGVIPDLMTTAKGLGGGFPIGALLAKEECSVFVPGEHATTFGGNPPTAVALAVVQEIAEDSFLKNVRARGDELSQALGDLVKQFPKTFSTNRGLGLMQGLVIRDEAAITAPDVVKAALTEHFLAIPAGPKVIRFVPPLIVTSEEIKEGVVRFTNACKKVI